MTVKIGRKAYDTRKPQDLDAAMIAATGCNAAEIAGMLAGSPLAGLVAQVLLPFIAAADRPDHAALATAIEAAGKDVVAAQVAALFGEAAAPLPPAPTPPLPPVPAK